MLASVTPPRWVGAFLQYSKPASCILCTYARIFSAARKRTVSGFCEKQGSREMASALLSLVETISYIIDPSNCLYGSFAMISFLARVFGPIVVDNFGESVGFIQTLDCPGRNS